MFSLLVTSTFFICSAKAQDISLMMGTDIPYQAHIGATWELHDVAFSVRSGVLGGPYSDMTLSILERLGTDDIYISLLDASYDFGWMNSIGFYYKTGRDKQWSFGPEFRFDSLAASDTSSALIETITGDTQSTGPLWGNKEQDIQFQLMSLAAGLRVGRSFTLDKLRKHRVLIELSLYKHYYIQTTLSRNEDNISRLGESLGILLWEDVFLPYGYLGGIGVAYSYRL